MWVFRDIDGERRSNGRRNWFWFVLGLLFGLGGCGTPISPTGTTHASYTKSPDGTESIAIHDGKDRGQFTATVTKTDGTSFSIQSSDSNGSNAQANATAATAAAMDRLLTLVQSGALVAVKPH